ncbi:MAG: alpha/beta fold hydrolase [Candidatus Nezhaarchaeota archaeon]|nr:alpha/beta fold hydrolase [Candidatus Nezhaarchaeota archaeon]
MRRGLGVIVEKVRSVKPGACEYRTVYEDWLFKLHRFKADVKYETPVLISYAFINRPYILDLHEEVSVIKLLTKAGLDVWLIDWGYPTLADRHLGIADLVDFIDRSVDLVRQERGVEKVTLWGYCLGATLAIVYASLHPERVRNLVIQAPLFSSETNNTLAAWARSIDPSKVSGALLNATGGFLNTAFLLADPVRLIITKYQSLLDNIEDEGFVKDFFYMEHWIFDSPCVPGKLFEEYITRWYHRNELAKGEFSVDGRRVDLSRITMPTLVLVAKRDHIVPPESATPFFEAIPSRDKRMLVSDKGHIGLTVSRSSHAKVWPEVVKWLLRRSTRTRSQKCTKSSEGS